MKKIISLLLVALMLISLLPMAVFAEDNTGDIVLDPDCFHSRLSYTNNGDDHTVTCAYCDYSVTEAHTYVNGVCVCGATEAVEDPTLDGSLVFFQTALALESEIGSQFIIDRTALNKLGFTDYKVSYKHYNASGEIVTDELTLNKVTNRYYAVNISTASTDMSDLYEVTLYGLKGDVWYHGEAVNWTVRDAAMTMIRDGVTDAGLKTLLASMLNYGAAAQNSFEYNTENLANALMTPEEAALALTEPTSALTNDKNTIESGTGLGVFSTALALESVIEMQFIFNKGKSYPADTLEAHITYTAEGATEPTTVTLPVEASGNYRVVRFSGLAPDQMRTVVSCEIFQNGVSVSPISVYSGVTYSYDYAEDADANQRALANALICYVDAANAYWNSLA